MLAVYVICFVIIVICSMAVSMHNQCDTCYDTSNNIRNFFTILLAGALVAIVGTAAVQTIGMSSMDRTALVIPSVLGAVVSLVTSSIAINMHNRCDGCKNEALYYSFIGTLVLALLVGGGSVVYGIKFGFR